MLTVPVHNRRGEQVGTFEFDEKVWGGRVNRPLLRQAVLMYEANRRVGTASTKGRSQVAGSGRKLYRQKGTGRARVGMRRTNKRRGGGTWGGPKPRDYRYRLPRQALRRATHSALLSKFLDHEAVVIDTLGLTAPKTKEMVGLFKALGIRESCLVVTEALDPVAWKSTRNIPGMQVSPASDLNAYDLLRRKRLLVTRDALARLTGQAEPTGANAHG